MAFIRSIRSLRSLRSIRSVGFSTVVGVCALVSSPAFAQTGSIRGAVVDPDERGVPAAEVLLTERAAVVARATTDESGSFHFADLSAGRYELHVVHAGFRAAPVAVALAAGDERIVTARLRLSAISEAVVVSAAHVDLPLSRTPASTAVISGEDLRTFQQDTVAAALRRVPGIAVARNGGEGSVTSLFARGGESDFTTVVIDGVPVNTFGGGFDFGHLTTGGVERIEVVRGPQSALWGGGAIGGVIQLVTHGANRRTLEATAEAGARGTRRVVASGAVPAGAWLASFGGERVTSDGFDGIARNGAPVSNDDWRSEHLGGAVRYTGATRFHASSRVERSERGYPGPFGSDPGGTFTGVDRVSRGRNDSVSVGASVSRTLGRARPSAQVSWFRFESDFTSPFDVSTSGSKRLTARVQSDLSLAAGADATVGTEWIREEASSTYIVGPSGASIPVTRSVASVFGEARYAAGPVFITAGLRVENIRRHRLDADANPFSPRPVLPDDTTLAVTPRVSMSWFVRPAGAEHGWTRVRGGAGFGIRPPDAFELAFTDNPGLKPERTASGEAGVEHAVAGGLLIGELTAFVNRYDDLIVTVGRSLSDASRYLSDNISNARARGIEALVTARNRAGVRASAAYTFVDAEVLAVDRLGVAPPPFKPGDRLLRRPRHQGWMEASWQSETLQTFVSAGARGRTLDVDPTLGAFGGLFANGGHLSVDTGAAWRVARHVELFGRVTNLLGRRYEEVLGFPAAGRRGYAGVRLVINAAGR